VRPASHGHGAGEVDTRMTRTRSMIQAQLQLGRQVQVAENATPRNTNATCQREASSCRPRAGNPVPR